MNRTRFWLLTLAFDLYWGVAVALRERAEVVIVLLALLAWLLCPHSVKWRLLVLTLAGIALDSAWLALGLFSFSASGGFPLWMMALWLAFACWWWLMLARFDFSRGWLVMIGAAGGPLAYFIGERLGAMELHQPSWLVFSALAVGWASALPLTRYLLLPRRLHNKA